MRSKHVLPALALPILMMLAVPASFSKGITTTWRQASKSELQTYLPARAPPSLLSRLLICVLTVASEICNWFPISLLL